MGFPSCLEDNQEARGESLRCSSRQQTKKTEVSVKEEMRYYKFDGKSLTQYVAKTILIQWAERKKPNVRRKKIL